MLLLGQAYDLFVSQLREKEACQHGARIDTFVAHLRYGAA